MNTVSEVLKKVFFILLFFAFFFSASVILIKPVLVAFLKKKIEHAVADSTISGVEVDLHYDPWSILCLRATGDVLIKAFEHDKYKAQNIKANLRWDRRYIYLDSLSAQVLDGAVKGGGVITLGNPLRYVLDLNFTDLDLARFVQDFELRDKFLLSGMLNGRITLSGTGKDIRILNGDFASPVKREGDLTIKDTRFLENMAANSKLPSNLIVDSFKNYHYNKGGVRMFLDHGDLNFDVSLEGAAGKRNLNVVLHDFNLN